MDVFHIFLAVMTGIAVIVFVALYFVKAGYGMFFDARYIIFSVRLFSRYY